MGQIDFNGTEFCGQFTECIAAVSIRNDSLIFLKFWEMSAFCVLFFMRLKKIIPDLRMISNQTFSLNVSPHFFIELLTLPFTLALSVNQIKKNDQIVTLDALIVSVCLYNHLLQY